MVVSSFQTLEPTAEATILNMSTAFAFPPRSFGGLNITGTTPSISICGSPTLISPDGGTSQPSSPNQTGGVYRSFDEPWQAQAFAIAVQLSQRGLFDWPEWVAEFATRLRSADRAAEDPGNDYYRQWLQALEHLLVAKDIVDPAEIDTMQSEWRRAYRNTPHGAPVELSNARLGPNAGRLEHDHPVSRTPISVSLAR